MRLVFLLIGMISLVFGIFGIFLPLLPTTPFLLLSAFCFARSSPRLYAALLNHNYSGPLIRNWERNGSISLRVKIIAVATMVGCVLLSVALAVPLYIFAIQIPILCAVAIYITTRPNT